MENIIDNQQPAQNAESSSTPVPIISVRDVTVGFGGRAPVLDNLSLDVYKGEVLGFIGPSGSGKSVLTRTILGLNKKQSGQIEILGNNIDKLTDVEKMAIDMRMGVLFQHGALFSALSVLENIQVPMRISGPSSKTDG